MLDWVQHVAPEEVNRFQGTRSFNNHFLKGIISEDSNTAFHVTVKADFADKSSKYMADTYTLPDFPHRLQAYINTIPSDCSHLPGRLLKGWFKFHLQLQSCLNPHKLMPSQQVQALPPSDEHPLGKCDAVLVHYTPPSGIDSEFFCILTGSFVHFIFPAFQQWLLLKSALYLPSCRGVLLSPLSFLAHCYMSNISLLR